MKSTIKAHRAACKECDWPVVVMEIYGSMALPYQITDNAVSVLDECKREGASTMGKWMFVLILCAETIGCFGSSHSEIDPKSGKIICPNPGPEFAFKGVNIDTNVKIKTKEIVTGKVKADVAIERLRTEVPNVKTIETINHIMCVANAQGRLSNENYEEFLVGLGTRLPPDLSVNLASVEPCGEKDAPCVDIARIADFSQSSCTSDGKRNDFVTFTDTYALTKSFKIYQARAQTRGNTEIQLFDLNHSADKPLQPIKRECKGLNNLCDYRWNLKVEDSTNTAKAKYVIKNGHSGKREGLGFWSSYKIRDISAEIKLPDGILIKKKVFEHEKASSNCLIQSNKCENLFANDQINLLWDWNMWDKCSGI